MKDKKAAVFVLILIIVGLAYGTHQMRKKMLDMRTQEEAAKLAADSAETQRLAAEDSLRLLKEDTDGLREFYRAWLPHLEAVQSPQAGEAKLIDAVKKGGVFSNSQRFENGPANPGNVISKTLKAQLEFEDEYAKAVNWMGQLERQLPTARTTEYIVRRGDSGNDVHISLLLEVPIFDPTAMVIERSSGAVEGQAGAVVE